MRKRWSVYIVKCRDGTLYTGITNDLAHRIDAHNCGIGCRYTRGRRPVRLLYVEEFPNRSSALRREARLKRLKRGKKLLLIQDKGHHRTAAVPSCSRRKKMV